MYVSPKIDCKHVDVKNYIALEKFQNLYGLSKKCVNCEETKENWVCLTCGEFFCSRYVNGHFLSHYEENKTHNICLSNLDLSFWCYDCEDYINNKDLTGYYRIASNTKFGNFNPSLDNLNKVFEHLKLDEERTRDIKYQILIEKLKQGEFKNISFITGAGISTTAGIPDFRSSESGLFKTLQSKHNLSSPEEFFFLETFIEKPELFYQFAKEFDLSKYKPTLTHWFMSFLANKGLVHCIYTQNIDGLELKAVIPKEKIVFAHGNIIEAHCCGCKTEIDIELQNTHIKEGKVLYCTDENCKMPCKPKVVFYGEKLPADFAIKAESINKSDLAFVMGTSLKVMPFNYLPFMVSENTWRVVINKEKVGREGPSGLNYENVLSKDLFIPGVTDDVLKQIIQDCGWKDSFDYYVENNSKN